MWCSTSAYLGSFCRREGGREEGREGRSEGGREREGEVGWREGGDGYSGKMRACHWYYPHTGSASHMS